MKEKTQKSADTDAMTDPVMDVKLQILPPGHQMPATTSLTY